jgi:ribokinase
MMSTNQVHVVGSACIDLVFHTERFPVPGETILGNSFASYPGGKGANQAVAIAKLGGRASFAGCIGHDVFGDVLIQSLRDCGVDTTHLHRHPSTPSGCASVMLDASGHNQIIVAPGANMELTAVQVDEAIAGIGDAIVLTQLEIPHATVLAASQAKRFILNPAPARELEDDLLSRCLAITPNEMETEQLVGICPRDPELCRAAAVRLLDKGVQNVVITLGSRGCFYMSSERELFVPAIDIPVVDTVAAGDAFAGALAWFYSEYEDWERAIRLATCVAGLSVSKCGAQPSMPSIEEVRAFPGRLHLGAAASIWD